MPKCFNGNEIYQKQLDQKMVVRCAKCPACLRSKQLKWSSRIMQEFLHHHSQNGYSEFFTGTYSPEKLPRTPEGVPTLHKSGVQKWMQNVRKQYGDFRYYTVGEYGSLSGRPHIHMALFCENPSIANAIAAHWKEHFGFTDRSPLNQARAAYLAKYTTKGLTSSKDCRLEPNQEPEFRLSSRKPPLGDGFARTLANQYLISRHGNLAEKKGDIGRTFRVGGQVYPIGDYTLQKARKILDIPETHKERAKANDAYEANFPIFEAEINPSQAGGQKASFAWHKRKNDLKRRSL